MGKSWRNTLPKEEKWPLLAIVGLNFWVYSAWGSWHAAWSFGNRFFAVLFPLFVVGIAALLQHRPRSRLPLALMAIYTFVLFLLFIASTPQLADPFNLQSLLSYWFLQGHAAELLSSIIEKISFVRAILLF